MKSVVRRFWLVALLLACAGCHQAPPKEHPADIAAREWLALLDAHRYSETWSAGSEWLRVSVSEQGWTAALRQVHAQSGELKRRDLHALRSTKLIKNLLEPGEFVIVQYASEYAALPGVETLVLRHEGDTWRVTGYRVEPRMPWD
ncbi:MAG: DUF4019 domain-containing protein [Polyangiaceae bacterium]|nr:DUF4019 domain-containing protein [Myxococcales bacterium]MCB9588005.1 DUF4019 domain-containing protein [Polyangiaceae bacterium]